jgi:hypothetical protein
MIQEYIPPYDVRFAASTYGVETKKFSIALLKIRYDKLDDAAKERAEKCLLYFKTGKPYK